MKKAGSKIWVALAAVLMVPVFALSTYALADTPPADPPTDTPSSASGDAPAGGQAAVGLLPSNENGDVPQTGAPTGGETGGGLPEGPPDTEGFTLPDGAIAVGDEAALKAAMEGLASGGSTTLVLAGDIMLTSPITLQNVTGVSITIQAGGGSRITATASRHIRLRGAVEATLILKGVTLAGGADALPDEAEAVGGIRVDAGSTLTLNGSGTSTIENCIALYGAGIRLLNGSAAMVSNITLQGNAALINSSAIRVSNSTLALDNVDLTGNQVAATGSGGTLGVNAGVLQVENSRFTGNTAVRGGAIRVTTPAAGADEGTPGEDPDEADEEEAIADEDSGPLYDNSVTILNTTMEANTASRSGGAVSVVINSATEIDTRVQVAGGSIQNNRATGSNGGGIYLQSSRAEKVFLTVENTAITGNSAANRGGGIGVSATALYERMALTGVAFSGNTASYYVDEISPAQKATAAAHLPGGSYTSLSTNGLGQPLTYLYNNYDVANRSNTYTVAYNSVGGGSFADSRVYASGAYVFAPDTEPAKTGHTFTGWYATRTSNGAAQKWNFASNTISSTYASGGVMTLTAGWELNAYEVEFDLAGADTLYTAYPPQSLAYGNSVARPQDPERFGYNFLGWYTGGGELYDFSQPVTTSFTLTARWEETDFWVTDEETFRRAMSAERSVINIVVENDIEFANTIYARSTSAQFQNILDVTVNIRPSDAWLASGNTHASLTMAGTGRHFLVTYGPNSPYTLTVNLTNIIIDSQTGYGGVEVREGSSFTLNGTDSAMRGITKNANGGAIYVGGASTLRLGGLVLEGNTASGSGGGLYIEDSIATLTGVTLTGNTAVLNGGGIAVRGTSSVVFADGAITQNHANIGGGASVSLASLEAGTRVSGTAFAGNTAAYYVNILSAKEAGLVADAIDVTSWSEGTGPVKSATAYNNYDIGYAHGYYTVTYSATGGSGEPVDSTHYGTDGKAVAVVLGGDSLTAPNSNYVFVEWNTQPNGAGPPYKAGDLLMLESNTTLYAIWQRLEYTITFDANGGSFAGGKTTASVTVPKGSLTTTPAEPSHDTLYFGGWHTGSDPSAPSFDFTKPIEADTTLYAHWLPVPANNFVMVFHTNGGTPVNSEMATFNSNHSLLGFATSKPGYKFKGWSLTADGSMVLNNVFVANETDSMLVNGVELHLYAVFTPAEYKLTVMESTGLDDVVVTRRGGSSPSSAPGTNSTVYTVTIEDSLTLTATADTGYVFSGWQLTLDGTSETGTALRNPFTYTGLTGDATVTPLFEKATYAVAVYDLDGDPFTTHTVTHGETLAAGLPDFSTEAVEHSGWRLGPAEGALQWTPADPIVESISLHPVASPRSLTLTLEPGNGEGPTSIPVQYGQLAGAVADPARTGHTFAGWQVQGTTTPWDFGRDRVYTNTTLEAVWEGIDARYPGDVNDIHAAGKTPQDEWEAGQAGYRVRKGDTLLLAHEAPAGENAAYTWYLMDETGVQNKQALAYGETLAFSSLQTGLHYVRLRATYTDAAATGAQTTTLYSAPVPIEVYAPLYDVTFYSLGEVVAVLPTEYLTPLGTPENPQRENHTFLGWFVDEAGTIPWDMSAPVTGPMGLHAGWRENQPGEFTVHFDTGGGSFVPDQTVGAGLAAQPPEAPTREGYTFAYWHLAGDPDTPYSFTTPVTGPITLVAKWAPVPTGPEDPTPPTGPPPQASATATGDAAHTLLYLLLALLAAAFGLFLVLCKRVVRSRR